MSTRVKFWLILLLAVVTAVLAYPREDQVLKLVGLRNTHLHLREGLDLQGGAHLVFQADLSKISAAEHTKAMNSVVDVIQRRINSTGTSETTVQTSGSNQVIVELPGVSNVQDAVNLIGQTAQLNFYEIPPAVGNNQPAPNSTNLTGSDLASAATDIDTQSGQPIIRFTLKSGAVKTFADLTTRINQENGRLLITLDNNPVFNGTVSSPITDGTGQMSGFQSLADAKKTTLLLNDGALPAPLSLVEQRTVGATLGAESVSRSIVAGLIGLGVVALFMILYYRLAGLLAVAALAIYTSTTLALYKLSPGLHFTIVLTLAGIAGFILSIGMAVDANILIFERMKEELRGGKSLVAAVEAGFDRAWSSIRDSNISTLITCLILYRFGAPIIKGFAVTLGIGVLISMFTAVVISRTLLRVIISTRFGRRPSLYGMTTQETST